MLSTRFWWLSLRLCAILLMRWQLSSDASWVQHSCKPMPSWSITLFNQCATCSLRRVLTHLPGPSSSGWFRRARLSVRGPVRERDAGPLVLPSLGLSPTQKLYTSQINEANCYTTNMPFFFNSYDPFGSLDALDTIHLAAQCEIPPHIAQYPFEIVSQRGVSHSFALFS